MKKKQGRYRILFIDTKTLHNTIFSFDDVNQGIVTLIEEINRLTKDAPKKKIGSLYGI